MRITRHLAKVALAAIVATSVSGFVSQSRVSALPSADPALLWIEGELNDNGGTLPSPFGGSDFGLTSDAIIALNAGGRGAAPAATTATANLAANINGYITGEAFDDIGSHYAGPIGKSMFAAELQGADINHFGGVDLEVLSRAALQTGGIHAGRFSDVSLSGDFSNGFGQAFNILALSRTAGGAPSSSVDFLLAQQCPAGGFRLNYDGPFPPDPNVPVTRGCTSDGQADTDATSLAIDALLALYPAVTYTTAVDSAAAWLIGQQDPVTGGFHGTGPTAAANTNTSGLAAQALASAGFVDAAARARDYIGGLQLDAASTTGTPAAGEEGAIALNPGAFDTALTSGIDALTRDQWRRATTQAVLALIDLPLADPVPVPPARLLDTRPGETTADGKASGAGLTAAGSTLVLQVAGRGGVPVDAAAAVLNVTATDGEGDGFVTVFPCDAPRPLASSVNFVAGTSVANAVVTGLSAAGTACLFVGTNGVNLVADVSGFFPASSGYSPLTPARLLDTRAGESTIDGTQLGAGLTAAGATLVLPVAGRGGVPSEVSAVVLNVTAVGGQGAGVVTVFPCGAPRPLASNLNFVVGTPTANAVITGLSAASTVCLYVGTSGVNLVVDVNGYFPAGSGYHAVTPARLLDTRAGEPTIDGAQRGAGLIAAGTTLVLPVAGRGGVPADATAAVLNVTAVGGLGTGFVTVYPCDSALPFASSLNFVADDPTPNAAIATSPVNLVADVSGYFG